MAYVDPFPFQGEVFGKKSYLQRTVRGIKFSFASPFFAFLRRVATLRPTSGALLVAAAGQATEAQASCSRQSSPYIWNSRAQVGSNVKHSQKDKTKVTEPHVYVCVYVSVYVCCRKDS